MEGRTRCSTRFLIGILLVAAGAAMLLENQGVISVGSLWGFWPVVLVAWGVARCIDARSRHQQRSGIWMTLVGLWLLVSIRHWWGLSIGDTWPALLIAFGVMTLWKIFPPAASIHSSQG